MLGVVLQGEACAIFLREGTFVRSRKYKRALTSVHCPFLLCLYEMGRKGLPNCVGECWKSCALRFAMRTYGRCLRLSA